MGPIAAKSKPADGHRAPPFLRSLALASPPIAMRAKGGAPLNAATRAELLEAVKAGQEVELELDIVAFTQKVEPNRNFIRLTAAGARRVASSLAGRPFIRDHAWHELDARGGVVLSSAWDGAEGIGEIRQTIRLTYPWAVEHALRGGLDSFSIAWLSKTLPTCSVCGEEMFSFSSDCWHWPGDKVKQKDGSTAVVEAIFSDGEGIETSGVLVPATEDTGVDEMRFALSALPQFRPAASRRKETKMRALLSLLALGDDADETAIVEAVRKLKTEHAALSASAAETSKALADAQARLEKVETDGRAARLEALVDGAYREGKMTPEHDDKGERIPSELETRVRELAALDFAAAEAVVKKLPRLGPAAKMQSRTPEIKRPAKAAQELTPREKKRAAELGLSEKEYLDSKIAVYGGANNEDDDEDKE